MSSVILPGDGRAPTAPGVAAGRVRGPARTPGAPRAPFDRPGPPAGVTDGFTPAGKPLEIEQQRVMMAEMMNFSSYRLGDSFAQGEC